MDMSPQNTATLTRPFSAPNVHHPINTGFYALDPLGRCLPSGSFFARTVDSTLRRTRFYVGMVCACLAISAVLQAGESDEVGSHNSSRTDVSIATYQTAILPLLESYCYGCHAEGASEGGIQLDRFANDAAVLADRTLWDKVLKNVRGGMMPPSGEAKPTDNEVRELAQWIKRGPFDIDPTDIDPGRVTIHRLNRLEYRNTIKDLLGVSYNTNIEFPPDAAGMGLDNIADLLSVSPMLLEKYLDAGESILEGAYPTEPIQTVVIQGKDIRGNNNSNGDFVTFNNPPEITYSYRNTKPGHYRLLIKLDVVGLTAEEKELIAEALSPEAEAARKADTVREEAAREEARKEEAIREAERKAAGEPPPVRRRFGRDNYSGFLAPTLQKPAMEARFTATVQSGIKPETTLIDEAFVAESGHFEFTIDQLWSVEPHKINFNVIMPGEEDPAPRRRRGRRRSVIRLPSPHIVVKSLSITPQPTEAGKQYFPLDAAPAGEQERRQYIQDGIVKFGLKAFRRPMDEETVRLLVDEVEASYQQTQQFKESIKLAMAKVLCSPRFLFRATRPLAGQEQVAWGLIDEYSLASRLSYFLWSSMPDDELLKLAGNGELRNDLDAQVTRMLADDRIHNLIDDFSGQWLQTRNVKDWTVVESAVLGREGIESRTPLLTNSVRSAMEQEATRYFAHVLKADTSVLDFVDSDYTFLNAELAEYYGIPGVTGTEMRRVQLPQDSSRGGVITAGSTLLVTSTTNRTSPVKRGVFVMDNFLGIKPHDPPPNIPSVEAASAGITDHEPTFREMLELHRKDALCASCHNLMDPIGLALDRFNAMGKYREREFGQPLDTSGQLASGEEFHGAGDLKAILRNNRSEDFYRCLTNKLMTYALGRGMDYYDTESIDQIVDRLKREDGRFSVLLRGIIYSSPFQKRRNLISPEHSTEN